MVLQDYQKLGLRCGLEIHQQLDTTKLFCSCPGVLRDDAPNLSVRRKLRAVAGEGGEVDVAALHEQLKGRQFRYEAYHDTTCLVELDEEPPHPISQEALRITLQAALLLKARIADVVQVMRKTVVDGSNTAGFQRTALVAYDGVLDTSSGRVSITTVCLEEDSARPLQETSDLVTYRLDRLGIPLIEIATGADIRTPEQCRESAEKIGMILRSTGRVKRGIGTIRQDVNVSIAGGARVEIKGAQELKLLPALVAHEAGRQRALLEIKDELARRKAKLQKKAVDLSGLFEHTSSTIIQNTLKKRGAVLGMKLSGFAGLLGKELQPGRRLGTELSDHAKVRAGVGGIFHSDELPKYGITEEDVMRVRKRLACGKADGFVFVAADAEIAEKALAAVHERALAACAGVPSEVRKANPDGTTSYLRPMPGAARMYPETDIPFIRPETKGITLPELVEQKIARFVKQFGLSGDLAAFVAKSGRAALFEELATATHQVKPAFIAEVLTAKLLELKRDHDVDPAAITDEHLASIIAAVNEGKLAKERVPEALRDAAAGKLELDTFRGISASELQRQLKKILDENEHAPFGALMGIAVKQLSGKAGGKEISEALKRLVGKGAEKVRLSAPPRTESLASRTSGG